MLNVTTRPNLRGLWAAEVAADAWETLPVCAVCQSDKHLKDVVMVTKGTIVSACTDCEYVFLRRRPLSTWFDDFYSNNWDRQGRKAHGARVNKTRKPNRKVEQFCSPHLSAGSRVLDVGAGFGSNLLAFREAGHHVHGIERSAHRARFLTETLGIPCTHTSIEDFQTAELFDLVCLHHVYEHVSNPRNVLSHVTRLLKPGGRVYIAVPDLWQEYPPKAIHFVPHLHWYSPRALERVLAHHGQSVLLVQTTQEIQVLSAPADANSTAAAPPGDEKSRSIFWDRLQEQITQPFGVQAGPRTIVWFKSKGASDLYWERHTFTGRQLAPKLLSASLYLLDRAPRRLSKWFSRKLLPHVLPEFQARLLASSQSGMLTVDSDSRLALPLTVEHAAPRASVWVK